MRRVILEAVVIGVAAGWLLPAGFVAVLRLVEMARLPRLFGRRRPTAAERRLRRVTERPETRARIARLGGG